MLYLASGDKFYPSACIIDKPPVEAFSEPCEESNNGVKLTQSSGPFQTLTVNNYKKKSRIRETPNLSTDGNRSTNTEKNTWIFLLLQGIWLSGGGLLCTVQQSTGLHLYSLIYTAFLSYAVHFTEKF